MGQFLLRMDAEEPTGGGHASRFQRTALESSVSPAAEHAASAVNKCAILSTLNWRVFVTLNTGPDCLRRKSHRRESMGTYQTSKAQLMVC